MEIAFAFAFGIMAFRHISLNVRLILIVIIILSTARFTKSDTELNYNVPNDIHFILLHYDVNIEFDVSNVLYGKCNIIIQINRPTKNIMLRRPGVFGIIEIDIVNIENNQNNNTSNNTFKKCPIKIYFQKFVYINETNIYIECIQSSSIDYLSPGTYSLQIIYASIIVDDGDTFQSYYAAEEKM